MFGDEDGSVATESSRVVFVYATAFQMAIIWVANKSDALNGDDGIYLYKIEEVRQLFSGKLIRCCGAIVATRRYQIRTKSVARSRIRDRHSRTLANRHCRDFLCLDSWGRGIMSFAVMTRMQRQRNCSKFGTSGGMNVLCAAEYYGFRNILCRVLCQMIRHGSVTCFCDFAWD